MTSGDAVFHKVRGSVICVALFLPLFYLPGIDYLYAALESEWAMHWLDLAYIYYAQGFTFFLLLLATLYWKIPYKAVFGRAINSDELWPALKLTVFLYIFSTAALYLVFYPLSFVAPDFVTFWLIDLPPIVIYEFGEFQPMPNWLNLVSLCIAAPFIEEYAFRGVLLHRWANKWGVKSAVIVSSVLFGLAHPDPIGATVFGMAMCILYLKSRSLWLPILCHSIYNFAVWLVNLGYAVANDGVLDYSIQDFQNEWWLGVACAVITLTWIVVYLRGAKSRVLWKLPDI